MQAIGLIANFDKPNAVAAVRNVLSICRSFGLRVIPEELVGRQLQGLESCAPVGRFTALGVEAVVVLGGDGTMLDAARRLKGQRLPMMGLNIGSLGYLTCVDESHVSEALLQLRNGSYEVSSRSTLKSRVERADGSVSELPEALNDVVVSRGISGTAIELELLLDEQSVSRFLCDGMIVATPTGSTAYSLAAGGPILMPDTEAFVISPICPHTLTSRPLVVRDATRIALRAIWPDRPMAVSADGCANRAIQPGDTVRIEKGDVRISVITLNGYNPCDVMRRKLGWGGRSHKRSGEEA